MALNKSALAKAMADGAASSAEGGDLSMKALGEAIENYLIANTSANYTWTATMTSTPFTPDPTVLFNAEFEKSGETFKCTPATFDEFIKALADFLKKIKIMVGSITYASKLKKILLRAGIDSRQIKGNNNGCVYGIEIDYEFFYTVIAILRENNIEYSVE